MAARAMWKGVLQAGTLSVPVKLYSAVVQERSVHFRLLHKTDHEPVQQQLVSAGTGEAIEYASVRKGFPVDRGRMVLLEKEELEQIEPPDSRDIEIQRFVAPDAVDDRLYERPYFLGPDGNTKAYFALVAALEHKQKLGIARWVMRDKEYTGALRVEEGYLMLITLRHAAEILSGKGLKQAGEGAVKPLEVRMAEQLIAALHGTFDPTAYRDQYRARVLDLVETKAAGRKPKVVTFRPKKQSDEPLADVLEASLAGVARNAKKRKAHA